MYNIQIKTAIFTDICLTYFNLFIEINWNFLK